MMGPSRVVPAGVRASIIPPPPLPILMMLILLGVWMIIMMSKRAPIIVLVLASAFVELVALDAIPSAACSAITSAAQILAVGNVFHWKSLAQVTVPQVRKHLNGLVLERLA